MASYIQTLQESLNCTIKLAVHTVHIDISNPSQLKPGIFAIQLCRSNNILAQSEDFTISKRLTSINFKFCKQSSFVKFAEPDYYQRKIFQIKIVKPNQNGYLTVSEQEIDLAQILPQHKSKQFYSLQCGQTPADRIRLCIEIEITPITVSNLTQVQPFDQVQTYNENESSLKVNFEQIQRENHQLIVQNIVQELAFEVEIQQKEKKLKKLYADSEIYVNNSRQLIQYEQQNIANLQEQITLIETENKRKLEIIEAENQNLKAQIEQIKSQSNNEKLLPNTIEPIKVTEDPLLLTPKKQPPKQITELQVLEAMHRRTISQKLPGDNEQKNVPIKSSTSSKFLLNQTVVAEPKKSSFLTSVSSLKSLDGIQKDNQSQSALQPVIQKKTSFLTTKPLQTSRVNVSSFLTANPSQKSLQNTSKLSQSQSSQQPIQASKSSQIKTTLKSKNLTKK